MGDVERAEVKSRQRAVLFYLMAVVLIANVVLVHLPLPADPDPASPLIVTGFWLAMVLLTVVNLLPIAPRRARRLAGLLNDESTQAHRRASFTAGFWAAMASAAALAIVATLHPIPGADVAKIIISAALAAALTSFATQELRATR